MSENPINREPGKSRFDALDTGALTVNSIAVQSGSFKVVLASGTDTATNVTVSGMTTSDVLVSVLSFTTATAIASVADRTSEYVVGTGHLVKASGTSETSNQLLIMYWHVA
jgi:hypothetical protein